MAIKRRAFINATWSGAAALISSCGSALGTTRKVSNGPDATRPVVLNDVHSMLNETSVDRVVAPTSVEAIARTVVEARNRGMHVSISGGRHAMGGQQFGQGTVHLDTRPFNKVRAFDRERGLITVQAGIQWPELVRWYLDAQNRPSKSSGGPDSWGISQKQTGADRLAIGGALSANAHGRGLTLPPMVSDVESFTLVGPDGVARQCSRTKNTEIFRHAVGGYGLFGVMGDVTLRLQPRKKLRRIAELRGVDGLAETFASRIEKGFLYGDFQFETDEKSPTYMQRGVFACYEPVNTSDAPAPNDRELRYEDWVRLLHLAHIDKAKAFDQYSQFYLSTNDQLYWSDTHQLSIYPDGYHAGIDKRTDAAVKGSEMITELYVPRAKIDDFLKTTAKQLRDAKANLIYGTVRLIEKDEETALPWAREPFACTVMNLHVDHSPQGIDRAKGQFRLLIDIARSFGGSYFLTYHRWAEKSQLLDCYPEFPKFLAKKHELDPDKVFQSEWYRHHVQLLG